MGQSGNCQGDWLYQWPDQFWDCLRQALESGLHSSSAGRLLQANVDQGQVCCLGYMLTWMHACAGVAAPQDSVPCSGGCQKRHHQEDLQRQGQAQRLRDRFHERAVHRGKVFVNHGVFRIVSKSILVERHKHHKRARRLSDVHQAQQASECQHNFLSRVLHTLLSQSLVLNSWLYAQEIVLASCCAMQTSAQTIFTVPGCAVVRVDIVGSPL